MTTDTFRLLRVEIADGNDVELDVDVAPRHGKGSWTTLITGRNGSGKSRLLAGIALAFDALDGRPLRRQQSIALEYLSGSREYAFRVDGKRVSCYRDGKIISAEQLPRPRTVVAATSSAFDKFPLPRGNGSSVSSPVSQMYRYLGMRDSRGRISARAGIFRALEQLFDVSDEKFRRDRVSGVFRYLGYKPLVEVSYTWTHRAWDFFGDGASPIDAVERYLADVVRRNETTARSAIPKYFLNDSESAKILASSVDGMRSLNSGREVLLSVDYRSPHPRSEDLLKMARQLARAGILQMSDITLQRITSSRRVNISDASSGELALAVTLLGLASSLEDASLVLLDEPEISLHPQWQSEFLEELEMTLSVFPGCHFIVATHSPTLVTGAKRGLTNVVDLERSEFKPTSDPAGKSVDEVLLRNFGVVNKSNLYLRDLLLTALRAAEDGDLHLSIYDEDMAALGSVRAQLPAGDPTEAVIDSLIRVRSRLQEGRQSWS